MTEEQSTPGSSGRRHAPFYRTTWWDYLLAGGLFALCILAGIGLYGDEADRPARALIYLEGRKAAVATLSQAQTLTPQTRVGVVRIEVSGGRIRVADSHCPRGICMQRGWISRPGETIVCLPGGLLIEIEGVAQADKYDVLSH